MYSILKKIFSYPDVYSAGAKIEAVARLAGIAHSTSIPLMILPIPMVLVFWSAVPISWSVTWFSIAIIIQAASLLTTHRYILRLKNVGAPDISYASQFARQLSLIFGAQGILWGSTTMLILVVDSPSLQILVLVMAMAYPFATLFGSSFWPAVQYSLMLPMCGLTILALLLKGDPGSLGLAGIWFVALLILHNMARQAHTNTMNGIQLQFDKDDLVERLRVQTVVAETASADKTRFLASASHDLRQPVHALALFTEALHADITKHASLSTNMLFENMKNSIRALSQLLGSLLDISKLDARIVQPELQVFDVSTIVDLLHAEYEVQAHAQGLAFSANIENNLTINSDPTLLANMLRNLTSNALRYTKRGHITLVAKKIATQVYLEVHDTGIGIAKEQQRDIFREFFQVANQERDRSQGLGLGLAIVERLAALLGHQLLLESELGKGSCFTIILPWVAQSVAQDLGAGSATANVPHTSNTHSGYQTGLSGLRVLVIDDESAVRAGMLAVLESWGCVALLAGSAAEALRQLAGQPAPQLIIADYRLRENKTGAQAIEAIRNKFGSNIPAHIITGDTDPQRLKEAQASGHTLMHKPVQPAKLYAYLQHIQSGETLPTS